MHHHDLMDINLEGDRIGQDQYCALFLGNVVETLDVCASGNDAEIIWLAKILPCGYLVNHLECMSSNLRTSSL